MTAVSKKAQINVPGDIEALLPWYAAGVLGARDARRVQQALAHDADLVRQYAVVREECAEIVLLNEGLSGASSRALQKLFAAIDVEPARARVPTTSDPVRLLRPGFNRCRIFRTSKSH